MKNISFDRIKILVTSGCNLRCNHCYQHFEKNKYFLTETQIFRLIDYACDHHVRILDFSGGEFFTHPSAYEIIEYCHKKKVDINIATNGIDVNVDIFEKYKSQDFISIQVSLDGMRDNHEARRGAGTWDKVMSTVKKLKSLGIKVTANMVLDSDNYLDAISVLQLPDFSEVFFTPIAYVGAAANARVKANVEGYEEFICQLFREFVCDEEEFSKQIFPYVLAVKYDGCVYISPIASDYALMSIGDINSEDIAAICDKYYESDNFKQLENLDVNSIKKCNCCSASNICDRGNRLRALKFHGDIMAPDPFLCRIYLDEYKNIAIGDLFWGMM